ncbi:hypothetical protein TNCV_356961 [Trichonephila clavipes]|nr:hypothetical protein TNCV_356961 [Trichonephila clavipes]
MLRGHSSDIAPKPMAGFVTCEPETPSAIRDVRNEPLHRRTVKKRDRFETPSSVVFASSLTKDIFCRIDSHINSLGKTPKETYAILVRSHEDLALSMKCVYEGFARFRESRESVSDNTVAKDRRPPSAAKALREKVKKLIAKDRRLTVRMMAEELQINRESVRQIVIQYLGMRKTWGIRRVRPQNVFNKASKPVFIPVTKPENLTAVGEIGIVRSPPTHLCAHIYSGMPAEVVVHHVLLTTVSSKDAR